jgi:hypothetical protein
MKNQPYNLVNEYPISQYQKANAPFHFNLFNRMKPLLLSR